MKPWSRIDWLNTLIFGALVLLFYWRIVTPNPADRQSFPPGDFQAQFWAFTTFEVQEFGAGRLPLWNPYAFAGSPFWADVQAAVFYPPSLLTLLLSAPRGFSLFALEIEAVVHIWLAAIFMYLFAREITSSRAAAVIASLTFTFSGYLTGYPSQQLAVLEADVWLPLILFFIHRSARLNPASDSNRSLSILPNPAVTAWLILAGAAWGLTLLAGHPQSALIVAYVSITYFLFRWLSRRQEIKREQPALISSQSPKPLDEGRTTNDEKPNSMRYALRTTHYALRTTLLPLLIFLLTGLALAAVQFIPAVEYTLLSVRAAGTYDEMSGGFPLIDLIQLLLPGQVSYYSPLYVGVSSLILAVWIPFTAPKRQTIFWSAVVLITLLIAFGGNTFLYSPLYLFTPGFSIFRGQERWAFATAFSLSILAGYGYRALSRAQARARNEGRKTKNEGRDSRSSLLGLTRFLLLFALLLAFLFFYGLNDTGWTPDSPFFKLLGGSTLLIILLGLSWLLWKFADRLSPLLLTGLTALLICFDLFSVNWQTNLYPQPPAWHTGLPPAAVAIKNDAAQGADEPFRVYNEFRLYDNYGLPAELEDLWGASPLRPARYDRFLAPPMPIERAWALLNVKYVITWRQELYVPSTIIYQAPAADGTTYVHRLDSVAPRAWLVHQVRIADEAAILQTLADPGFDPQQMALLEADAAPYLNGLAVSSDPEIQGGRQKTNKETVRTTHLTPQSLSLQVDTSSPALLILSETDYPGWQASLDGQPVPILRANYILRAVPLPAGQHTVSLTFRPRTFTLGAIVSGLTLLLVIVGLILSVKRFGGYR